MQPESEILPYEPAKLAGERLLVLAPHPDDEAIGCGGVVAQHLRSGRMVRVIVVTDGAEAAQSGVDLEAYRITREEETRRGLQLLGGHAEVEFLRLPDRKLDGRATEPIARALQSFKPDLILVPSPIDIHPDHVALARIFCDLIAADETLFADVAVARVAFYEVSQPIRPNTLVDITDVAEAKYAAIGAHASQMAVRDYTAFARGLNAYRALTLPAGTAFAEAYWVTELPRLRTLAFSVLRNAIGTSPPIEVASPVRPVSVIVRTKNRPALLSEALSSIRATGYPAEIVVVNDGGRPAEGLEDVRLVEHTESRGRSEAMNSGVRAATSEFIAFLDDDDLYYPDHLATLSAAAGSPHIAWYTDAVSAFARSGPSGQQETHTRLRLFNNDFDRDLLLVDNYIPLPTVLLRRESFLECGGFDPAFDLFEDWDFLIRLSRRGDFARVPRITCEIRNIAGGDSITLAAPEGSSRFREAQRQVWKKHEQLIDTALFASVLERQKQRASDAFAAIVDEKGWRHHAQTNIDRLEREKNELISQIQTLHNNVTREMSLRREVEGMAASLREALADLERRSADHLAERVAELTSDREARDRELLAYRAEVGRLQGLLDLIYRSRTWKLHTAMEKLRGRG